MSSSPSPYAFMNQLINPKLKDAVPPKDLVEANRRFYDILAPSYDQQAGANGAFTRAITDATLQLYPFNKEKTTMLDFACGTGMRARLCAFYSN
jgi:ubiquinone/menaquinone biosynthesis C-methylase UbiE